MKANSLNLCHLLLSTFIRIVKKVTKSGYPNAECPYIAKVANTVPCTISCSTRFDISSHRALKKHQKLFMLVMSTAVADHMRLNFVFVCVLLLLLFWSRAERFFRGSAQDDLDRMFTRITSFTLEKDYRTNGHESHHLL